MIRLLVCGSRDFGEGGDLTSIRHRGLMWYVLDGIKSQFDIECVIEGECPFGGADKQARRWAEKHEIPVIPFPARRSVDGKLLGPERNTQMLEVGRPSMIVGFINKPLHESRGTRDMLTKGHKAGIHTWHVEVWK